MWQTTTIAAKNSQRFSVTSERDVGRDVEEIKDEPVHFFFGPGEEKFEQEVNAEIPVEILDESFKQTGKVLSGSQRKVRFTKKESIITPSAVTKTEEDLKSPVKSAWSDKRTGCFSGECFVFAWRGTKKISELWPGDGVWTGTRAGEVLETEVCARLHQSNDLLMQFLQLKTKDGFELELTPNHLIFAESAPWGMAAGDVAVGDRVWVLHQAQLRLSPVVSISSVQRRGFYALATLQGSLLVNGILVSCYANGAYTDFGHSAIHRCLAPLRMLHISEKIIFGLKLPSDKASGDQSFEKINVYVKFLHALSIGLARMK